MTHPKAKPSQRKLWLVVGCVATLIALWLMLLPSLAWSGGAYAEFHFSCLDDRARSPVTNRVLRVIHVTDFRDRTDVQIRARPHVETDAKDDAVVKVLCGAGGRMGLFGKTGDFTVNHELWADAPGYRPVRVHLASILGGRSWPLKHRRFDVKLFFIELPPGPQP